jgi:hypothetical protein
MSLSRPTASSIARKFVCSAGVCLGLVGLSAAPALAKKSTKELPAAVAEVAAVCPGQTFSQPFEALKDSSYYTLVEGSEFNSPGEGWELGNGAQLAESARPDGSSGNVLDLPAGAYAVSPPVCVTLQYPTARAYVEDVQGAGGVTVGVYYAGSRPTGQVAGQLSAKKSGGWELSNPFDVKPQLGGSEEGIREVRFIFANTSRGSDFHLSGLYVDPRMV